MAALVVGASLTWAIPAFTDTRLSPAAPAGTRLSGAPTGVVKLTRTVAEPAPGVYKAAPYSMLVVVPEEVDPRMVHRPDASGFKMPIYRPPMHFDKR